MAKVLNRINRLPVGKCLVLNLFLLTLFFQVFLITRRAFFYHLLRGLFFALLLLLALGVVRLVRKDKLILFCLVFIIAIRIPYYIHPDSLLFMSDNALEALQPLEIRDAQAAPFFLLDSSSHNGTLKYLCLAYLYELFGARYLVFLLFQLLIFLGIMVLVYDWLRRMFDGKVVLLLVFAHFAFIEVIFDYSLFLRGGPYLEMLFFFVLGVRLFDFTFSDWRRVFPAVYFLMIAIYLHSLAIFFAAPLLIVAALYSLKSRSAFRLAGVLTAGALAGQFHFVYYKLFYPPPPPAGGWYKIHFFPLSDFALNRVPAYAAQVAGDFQVVFNNLFSFEFLYHYKNWDSFEYYFQSGSARKILFFLNASVIYLSWMIFIAALVLVLIKLVRRRFFGAADRDWIYPFYLFLLLVILGKLFLLSPAPHIEPRHNLDLAFLLMLSYVIVAAEFLKVRRIFSWKSLAVAALSLLLTAPHYFTFLRVASFKHRSYQELMPVLEEQGIKYLSTDFGIAYIIHFLSGRRIYVSDTIGPVSIGFFYPWLKEKVDRVPPERRAYLFFSERYPRHRSFHEETRKLIRSVRRELDSRRELYRIVEMKYYLLIIPNKSRLRGSGSFP